MTKKVLKIYRLESDTNLAALTASFSGYSEQKLTEETEDIRLFYHAGKTSTPSWKGLFTELVEQNQAILEKDKSSSESFVCLIKAQNDRWYGISGGYGHHTISGSIEPTFGTDILVRVIDESDQSLIAASERSVTGGQVASSIHYRKISRFFEYKRFGSITNKVDAEIRDNVIEDCFPSVHSDDIGKIRIAAGSNLQIKVGLDILTLQTVIEDCEALLLKDANFNLNSIRPISKSDEPELVKRLDNQLYEQMFKLYQGEEGAFPFDICHNDFDRYLTSSNFKVLSRKSHELADGTKKSYLFNFLAKRGEKEFAAKTIGLAELRLGQDLFTKMRETKTIATTPAKLAGQLKSAVIHSFDEDGVQQTSGSFLSHVMGDVTLVDDETGNEDKYFLFDSKWYQLEDEFLTKLNTDLKSIYENSKIDLDLLPWADGVNEGHYNEAHIGEDNVIVTDRLLHENIEVCDLIIQSENMTYLVHVKKGFGNTVRELCNQVAVSSARLHNALRSANSNAYLESLHERFLNYGGEKEYFVQTRAQFAGISLDDFKAAMSKPLCVVLAFKDDAVKARSLDNPEDYNSAIAKFSIIELRQTLAATSVQFGIVEIS